MKLMILSHNKRLNQDNNKRSWKDANDKFQEESLELVEALSEEDKYHIAEETMDVIQVCTGILDKLQREGIDLEQIFLRHEKKLVNREWTPKAVIEIEVKAIGRM